MRRFIILLIISIALVACGEPVEWKTATVTSFSEPISGVQIGSYVWEVSFDNGDIYYIEDSTYRRNGPMHVGFRYDYAARGGVCNGCRKHPFMGAYHESITGR